MELPKYKDKSKAFVIQKLAERIGMPEGTKGRIEPEKLNRQISDILFERDYTTVAEMLKEYRKGEIQKQMEVETNPQRRLEIMIEQAAKGRNLTEKGFKRKRRGK